MLRTLLVIPTFVLSLGLLITTSFAVQAQESKFTEGDYYLTIKGEQTKNKEITEFYSFYCPACFKQEPMMQEIIKSMPANSIFKKNHVDGMPGRDLAMEQALTKALITADKLNIKDKMVPAIFNHIHLSRAKFSSVNDIKDLFIKNGLDADKFDKTFNSFSVNMAARQMQKKTANIRQQGFSSVPTLIINGKYKPLTTKIKDINEYKALIHFLLNK